MPRITARHILIAGCKQSMGACVVGGHWLSAAVLLMCLVVAPADANSIRLRAEATVHDATITLADIAELTGDQAAAMGGQVVGHFVGDGDRMVVKLDQVRRTLEAAHANWGLLSLGGYQQCEVRRVPLQSPPGSADRSEAAASDSVSDDSGVLRKQVVHTIHQLASVSADHLRIRFDERDEQRLTKDVAGARYEIEPRTSDVIGRVLLSVRRYEAGKPVERFTVTADVERRAEVIVATRHINRGERFEAEAVERRTVWLSEKRQPLNETSLVVGQQAASVLNTGDYVYPDDVRTPILVQRGERVTVRCLSGNLVLRTVGRAVEEGAMDEIIRIRNEGSNETFRARVTGRLQAVVRMEADGRAPRKDEQAGGER